MQGNGTSPFFSRAPGWMYFGGRDVETSDYRGDCTLRLRSRCNSAHAAIVTQGTVSLSENTASAVIGRPLTPMSVGALIAERTGVRIGTGTTGTDTEATATDTTVRGVMATERTSLAITELGTEHIGRRMGTRTSRTGISPDGEGHRHLPGHYASCC